MRKKEWGSRHLLSLVFCVFAVFCLTGCRSDKDGSSAVSENNGSETETGIDEDTSEGDVDMEKEEVFAVIKEKIGIDLSGYAEEADGVRNGSIYYTDLTVPAGKEEEVEQVIIDLCGKGSKASSRKRPVLKNRIAESFDQAELLTVYDHMRQGSNGAKTASTTIYTAEIEGKKHIFIFGS